MTSKQHQMMEFLKMIKAHCDPRDTCEGCELHPHCKILFNEMVEEWDLDEIDLD